MRPYQEAAIRKIFDEFYHVKSTALIMATGLGKTVIFASIAQRVYNRTQKPVLVLAHRSELIEQTQNTLGYFGLEPLIEQGDTRAVLSENHGAIVASVASLSQADRLKQFPADYFSLIITDEAHHAVTESYRRIYSRFRETKHLGVTATPLRSDSIGLKNVFQSVAFQYSIQQGIEEKYLCPIKGRQITVKGLELEKIKLSGSDFSSKELDEMLMRDRVLQRMVLPTIEHAGQRQTIVFTQSVGHAKAIADAFNRASAKNVAVAVDGNTPQIERQQRINAFKRGDIQFIVNVGVLTEGFDHPPTSCIALFRPTRSLGLLTQMVGRGTRISPGKPDCLVLDFVGVQNTVKTLNVLDVLDGTVLSEAEKTRAQKLVDEGEDAVTALEKAKIDIAKLEALQVKWKALSSSNPFDVMKLFAVPSRKGLYGGQLATHYQRSLLEIKGIKTPATLERGEAELLLRKLDERIDKNLASFKQLKKLKSLGFNDFDPQKLSRKEAHRLIGEEMKRRGLAHLVRDFESKAGYVR